MAAPDIGACVSAGIAGFKKNPLNHIVATLLVVVISGVGFGLLTGPMLVGYMRMIQAEAEGTSGGIGDVFKGFDDFVPALLSVLLASLVVSIGFMLCVLPGLLIMPLVPIAAYLVATGEKDGIQALSRAWSILKANLVGAALCMLILGILGNLGFILCGIGALLTLPIAFIGIHQMARQLADDGQIVNA